jgi:hypothetical protein
MKSEGGGSRCRANLSIKALRSKEGLEPGLRYEGDDGRWGMALNAESESEGRLLKAIFLRTTFGSGIGKRG